VGETGWATTGRQFATNKVKPQASPATRKLKHRNKIFRKFNIKTPSDIMMRFDESMTSVIGSQEFVNPPA